MYVAPPSTSYVRNTCIIRSTIASEALILLHVISKKKNNNDKRKSNMDFFSFCIMFSSFMDNITLLEHKFIYYPALHHLQSLFKVYYQTGSCLHLRFRATLQRWCGNSRKKLTLGTATYHMLGSNDQIMTFQINHLSRPNL